MLLLTTTVGLAVWAISYSYQNYKLTEIFHESLSERFNKEAREHNTRFYRYLKTYNPAVKDYANNISARNYIQSKQWIDNKSTEVIFHQDVPAWLPSMSIMRSYLWPRYALLLDHTGQLRELYHYQNPMPPEALLNMTPHEVELTREQSYVMMRGDRPFVASSEYIGDGEQAPILLIASPVDEELLNISQGVEQSDTIIALLKDEETSVLVSSNNKLIPIGTELSSLNKDYLITDEGHFDTGSSEMLITFVSLISTQDVQAQTEVVLNEDRRITILTAVAYIASFALVMLWITSRIQKLTNRVVKFSEDMEIAQPDLDKKDQLDELESRFELLASAILTETTALEHQAHHDPLTNMPNRKLFNNQLQHLITSSAHSRDSFILILSDLDRFKEINDTLGHHIGDVVLQKVGDRLRNVLRSHDMVARLGGDEFGILLASTSIEQAEVILKKVLEAFEEPFDIDNHQLDIALSMGIVEYPMHGGDVNVLMQRADVAMYNAKNNCSGFSTYESSEDSHAVSRLALAAELRQAINNNVLRLFYQPKINLETGQVFGAEALLRWEHPERGFISPGDFIPLAEHTGLIQPITTWVIDNASRQCSLWNDLGHKLRISINISTNCIHDGRLPAKLNEVILKNKLTPDQLTLELTENIFIKDPVRSKKILDNVSKMGVGISIDDFGTGYSSLAYLKQLPVNEIKIDRSFIMDMLENESDAVIVRATIDLAHNLGMKVVAEGVESKEIVQLLKILGCDEAQGYYLGRPMEVEDFITYLEKNKSHLDLS